jgi:hydroxyacylglutathione hydrolase
MRVVPVPCLSDNFAYLLICPATHTAAVIDPSEEGPVTAAAAREGVTLAAIWNTHHHGDHVDGNTGLLARQPDLEVVGFEGDRGRIPGQTRFVAEGDTVKVGTLEATVIHNPGHTRGAVSFHVSGGALFTGDTLFGAGCGRLFEGTPADMHASLGKLAALPGDTRVYCGHEYTAKNLDFAAAVEPDNPAVRDRRRAVGVALAAGQPSVPFTMLAELTTNPFLRCHLPEVAAAARAREPEVEGAVEVFAAIRRWKDKF